MTDSVRIVAAALLMLEGETKGEVVTLPPPARHDTLINHWCKENQAKRVDKHEQGFVDNEGRFLRRAPAAYLAWKAGQITEPKKYLYSEDLW